MSAILAFPQPGGRLPLSPALSIVTATLAAAPPTLRALPATGGRRGEYAIADIARSLGLLHFGVRTIIDKLRTLARDQGMPLPRTPRIVRDTAVCGPLVIYSKSRWDAGEFDAWLDDRGPHGAAAPRPVAAPLADEMARRADRLGAVA